eukprot:CAMPEP_0196804842 /NCGR_PEP_ID=MMETSP1362-20130617/4518_1 /TAXON_ID=163516 /ORGANISM="Leptocylindrus danicus, Strain CCMP1856" /LENGTH=186 /DNA_ID=CAMNT_0042177373 /DNA_START=371 /DNA_END=931 /DNA_ORIENTATION=+
MDADDTALSSSSSHKTPSATSNHEQNSDSSSSPITLLTKQQQQQPDDHDANIVSDTCSSDSNNDDSSVDAASTCCSNSGWATGKKSKKRVTWSAWLDDLDYVPTRSSPRRRVKRRQPTPAKVQKRKALSPAESGGGGKVKNRLQTRPKESKTRRKGEAVTKVEYLTGTMYIFSGSNPRVEFVRHSK